MGDAKDAEAPSTGLERPTILIIFGITGNLARKKLLPALHQLFTDQKVDSSNLHIVGITRQDVDADAIVRNVFDKSSGGPSLFIKDFKAMISLVQLDPSEAADYQRLTAHIHAIEKKRRWRAQKLFYLSMPPHLLGAVIDHLGQAELNQMPSRTYCRLLIEKPFGFDLSSAQELIDRVATHFNETQVYRIDHYLARETVQNLLAFRFHNPLFASSWNHKAIERVVITASERIGIEGRKVFYEQTGALRDFVQSHLMQLLALITMEEPRNLSARWMRSEKVRLLKAVQTITPHECPTHALRAQYEGYRKGVGNPSSTVETAAAVKLFINNPRWKGVPFILRTGKYLYTDAQGSDKLTTIVVTFRNVYKHSVSSNELIFRLQPDEGISLKIFAKAPGFTGKVKPVAMEFSYADSFNLRQPAAYERVLFDAIRGEQTLFASAQEVLHSWRVLDNVIQAWQRVPKDLKTYPQGAAMDKLLIP